MKKLNVKLSVLGFMLISAVSIVSIKAEAEDRKMFSVGVIGGLVYDYPHLSSNDGNTSFSTDGKSSFGGGLTAELSLPIMLGIEVDLLYFKHKFSQNNMLTYSSGTLQLPLIVRVNLLPFLNPGAGLYYSRVVTSWTVSSDNSSSTTINYGKNDFGFVLALGAVVPLGDAVNIVADLRYLRSLNDSGGSTDSSLKFSQLQLFAGIKFNI